MKEKTIAILGRDVRVRYCAATENGFEQLRSKSILDIDFKRQEDLIALAVSAVVAAYARENEDAPITSNDLLYNATPEEIALLLTTTIELRNEWYSITKVVEDELKDEAEKAGDEQPKNV